MAHTFTPQLNLDAIKRKQKGLIKLGLGGIASKFYYTDVEVVEGTPMKLSETVAHKMEPVAQNEAQLVRGLAMQITYEEANSGQLAQLAGYNFPNDTAQRLDGQPIGLLMGHGYAKTDNFVGEVNPGDRAYLTADGRALTAAEPAEGADDARLPIVFEQHGEDGDIPVTIRFDFPVV